MNTVPLPYEWFIDIKQHLLHCPFPITDIIFSDALNYKHGEVISIDIYRSTNTRNMW